jgi:hypothetical protein
MGRQTEATDQPAAEEHALDNLNQARQGAQAETRAAIESAAERTREVLHDLKGDVTGRAEELRTWHREQSQALDAMAHEIKRRKKVAEQIAEPEGFAVEVADQEPAWAV